jgi:hypothetical protein
MPLEVFPDPQVKDRPAERTHTSQNTNVTNSVPVVETLNSFARSTGNPGSGTEREDCKAAGAFLSKCHIAFL